MRDGLVRASRSGGFTACRAAGTVGVWCSAGSLDGGEVMGGFGRVGLTVARMWRNTVRSGVGWNGSQLARHSDTRNREVLCVGTVVVGQAKVGDGVGACG